jgi:ubiquinone/menaquinone biosynthesis C-methylase UbiE
LIEQRQPNLRRSDDASGAPAAAAAFPHVLSGDQSPHSHPVDYGEHRSANLNRYTTRSRLYRWHTAAFHDALYELVATSKPRTLLDAGCGEGFVANLIAERDPSIRITGIDASDEVVAFARRRFANAADFHVGSVFELPFEDDSFDLVMCSEVLEHLRDPLAAVRELTRVSRRHVLITVPREPVFQMLNDIGKALRLCGDPGHVQFWTKQSFQEYFEPHFAQADFSWKHTYQLVLGTVR